MENPHYYQVFDRKHPEGVSAPGAFMGWVVLDGPIHKTNVLRHLRDSGLPLFILEINSEKYPAAEGLVEVGRHGCVRATHGLAEKLFRN
jgi:hypothetical protein